MTEREKEARRSFELVRRIGEVLTDQRSGDAFCALSYLLASLIAQGFKDKNEALEYLSFVTHRMESMVEQWDAIKHQEIVERSPPEDLVAIHGKRSLN